jgi:hypothetical protein
VTVTLEWSDDSGQTYNTIAQVLPSSGEWPWSVPAIDTATARVRATATDLDSNTAQDDSGNFTITTSIPEFPVHAILPAGALAFAAIVQEIRRRKRIRV